MASGANIKAEKEAEKHNFPLWGEAGTFSVGELTSLIEPELPHKRFITLNSKQMLIIPQSGSAEFIMHWNKAKEEKKSFIMISSTLPLQQIFVFFYKHSNDGMTIPLTPTAWWNAVVQDNGEIYLHNRANYSTLDVSVKL